MSRIPGLGPNLSFLFLALSSSFIISTALRLNEVLLLLYAVLRENDEFILKKKTYEL